MVVPGGSGPGGPLRRGRGGRAETVFRKGGAAPGGRRGSGWSAWWVVLPSHALVLFVHGRLWPGGVRWWAVVVMVVGVVLGVMVVVVVVVVVARALVVVALVVVVMVLWACS